MSNWSSWTALGTTTLSTNNYDHAGFFTAIIENGNQIQVRVYDENEDASVYYESNTVTYTGVSKVGQVDLANS